MVSKIYTQVTALEDVIRKARVDILTLQAKCKHKHTTIKEGGSTGNYDPTDDCYWSDYTCTDCKKQWREYSE